jgi:hypothetical protein
MSAVLAARERERLRQMELEAQRTAEQLAMLEAHLEAARADAEKAEVTARWKVSAANERARLAEARAAALEEALATTAMPARPRYALADAEDPPRDRDPHGAVALMGTSLSSPLSSPRGARRGDSAADLVAAVTPPGDARAGREVSASSSSEGAAAAFAELVTWRRPGKSAKVFFGGLYVQLCVSSLRAMPLPFGTAACYGFIFALAFSLLWRLARGLRLVLWGGASFSSENLGGKRRDDDVPASGVGRTGDETILTRRETRERDARRFAAKFGGWIAASAARRAPAVAMTWLFCERTFLWEHPPTTLKACVALWLCSLVARVWRAPLDATIFAAWVLTFAAPPALAAFGPFLETSWKAVVDDARVRFAYLLDDRRVQLLGLCVAWSAAGLAGRTLIGLAAATLFLTGGERAGNAGVDFGGARGNGGVTITELPSSPETGVLSVAREAAAARSPRRKPTTPERLAAAERRPSLASARPARAARDAFPSVVAPKRDPISSPSTSEDSLSPPRASLALKNKNDEPQKKAVDKNRRVVSVTERTFSTTTTRRYGAAAGVTNASEARQRMIAERTRRILDDE